MERKGPTGGSTDIEQLWTRTRQGARNVAGVRFQTAVAAYLLAGVGMGTEVAVQVKPEGLEDIDCVRPDGRPLFVQVKERAGGAATFSVGDVAAAIEHARPALDLDADSTLAIVTDARPGRGLEATGWDDPLSRSVTPATKERFAEALAPLGEADVDALLERCHLVRLEWDGISATTRTMLAESYSLAGAAADLLRARLLEDLAQAAAGQRDIAAADAATRARSDLDVLAARVSEIIDPTALDAAVATGLAEHLDFTRPLKIPVERFLTGVDVLPGHVAAQLDVLRVDELTALFDALAADRYVVIAGPSGSGKSALLWRAAHELSRAHRVVRVRRVRPEDVAEVRRWIRTLQPAPATPVLVCADDLGRPSTAGWPDLSAELLEEPGVHLLGCAREEDFTPSLVAAGGVPLRPQLSETLAHEIEAQLVARQIPLKATAAEALPEAQGLLMEFVAILATGARLEQVVTAQVHDRLTADRRIERDALRYVAAVHVAGLDLHASVLRDLCAAPSELQQALARLSREFLVRAAGPDSWRGLHELRSSVVYRVLHEVPPPTEEETLQALVGRLESREGAHLIRRIADRGGPLDGAMAAVRERVRAEQTTASDAATWLDAAIAVDVGRHLQACMDAVDAAWSRPDIPLLRFAWLRRFARLPDDFIPDDLPLDELAAVLPEPSTGHAAQIAATIPADGLVDLAVSSPSADAVALIEAFATAGSVALGPSQVRSIVAAHGALPVTEFSRLVAALWTLSPQSHSDPASAFGGRNLRLDRLASADTSILRWTAEPDADDPDAIMVQLEVFVAAGDIGEDRVRELGRLAFDLCPEAIRVQIEPRGPKGIFGEAPVGGGGRMHRRTYANPRVEGRRPRLMSDALERSRAARSWAERLSLQRQLVEAVEQIVDDTFARVLAAVDDDARRRAWLDAIIEARRRVDALPAPPLPAPGEEGVADPARDTLERIVLELRALADGLDRPEAFRRHGAALRRAFSGLWLPYRDTDSLSDAGLDAQIAGLRRPVMFLADLLISLAQRPDLLRCDRPTAETAYREVAATVVQDAREAVLDSERNALEVALPDDGVTLTRLPGSEPVAGRLVDDNWLIGCRPDLWDHVIHEAPARLAQDMRRQLAERMLAMYEVDGMFIPAAAFRIGEERAKAVPATEAAALADAAGVERLEDPQLDAVLELRDTLVSISALSANLHQRESRFGTETLAREAEALLRRAEELTERIEMPQGFPPSVPLLIELAGKEFKGSTGVSQAAGMAVLSEFGENIVDSLLLDQVLATAVAAAVARARST
ncbi:MAG: hypothetical protein M3340_00395 [Actinomycetota bacterium]|nr:hypothetical protein [Actinomycetota bacterium]